MYLCGLFDEVFSISDCNPIASNGMKVLRNNELIRMRKEAVVP
jgi:hypothetical protein